MFFWWTTLYIVFFSLNRGLIPSTENVTFLVVLDYLLKTVFFSIKNSFLPYPIKLQHKPYTKSFWEFRFCFHFKQLSEPSIRSMSFFTLENNFDMKLKVLLLRDVFEIFVQSMKFTFTGLIFIRTVLLFYELLSCFQYNFWKSRANLFFLKKYQSKHNSITSLRFMKQFLDETCSSFQMPF